MKANSKKSKNRVVQTPEIPVNDAPSNSSADKLAYAACILVVLVALGLLGGGGFWSIHNLMADIHQKPVDWVGTVFSLLGLVACVLIARAMAWIAVFGPIILGTRMGGWKSLETLATNGMKLSRLYPGGSAWLSTALVQSLVNRGKYAEALEAAESEWKRTGSDDRQAANLGTLCFAAGVANQAQADSKQAQVWNERAISVLNKSLEQLAKPAKGFIDKLQSTQAVQVAGQLRMQLAAAYINNATIYFNNTDYRRAKENYKLAADNAVKAPDFPQKQDIIRFANEQLGRLKHT